MDEFSLYLSGHSIPEVTEATGIPLSTLRHRFKKAGILRSRGDGIRAAASKGKIGRPGVKRHFSDEWRDNLSRAKSESGRMSADSIRINTNGYAEFTRGEHKGRAVHCVVMEIWLGRTLSDVECVHHIDGDRTNNSIDNLALMTRSGHARLHRREDQLAGVKRDRRQNGTWS